MNGAACVSTCRNAMRPFERKNRLGANSIPATRLLR